MHLSLSNAPRIPRNPIANALRRTWKSEAAPKPKPRPDRSAAPPSSGASARTEQCSRAQNCRSAPSPNAPDRELCVSINRTLETRERTMSDPTGIDTSAPVLARHGIDIDAPLDVVWDLHTDVNRWPEWQTDITAA